MYGVRWMGELTAAVQAWAKDPATGELIEKSKKTVGVENTSVIRLSDIVSLVLLREIRATRRKERKGRKEEGDGKHEPMPIREDYPRLSTRSWQTSFPSRMTAIRTS